MQFRYFLPTLLALAAAYAGRSQNLPDLSATAPSGTAVPLTQPPALSPLFQPSWVRTYVPKIAITDAAQIQPGISPVAVQMATAYKDGFNRTMQTVQHNFN